MDNQESDMDQFISLCCWLKIFEELLMGYRLLALVDLYVVYTIRLRIMDR